MKNKTQTDSNKVSRIITIINLIVSSIIVLGVLWNILTNALNAYNHELIPNYLFFYSSFVPFISTTFFAIILLCSIRLLQKKTYTIQKATFLLGFIVLYTIFASNIFEFLMYINPFGS